ncbi:hypothetical protein AAES_30386 [Amazona aestiva]|uniref:Matrix-remodeling-associated protein 7 n=1 Tax=Amazona aestiva TaxID=12930 RepID=A0A0Q3RDD4_AMAAE|nr:hypothetical protein AAES_30386 [Amazona aestiva]
MDTAVDLYLGIQLLITVLALVRLWVAEWGWPREPLEAKTAREIGPGDQEAGKGVAEELSSPAEHSPAAAEQRDGETAEKPLAAKTAREIGPGDQEAGKGVAEELSSPAEHSPAAAEQRDGETAEKPSPEAKPSPAATKQKEAGGGRAQPRSC